MLAGEITYRIRPEEAEEPAMRLRRFITHGSNRTPASESDLLSLRVATVDLASLLVRAAANLAAGGQAGDASEDRSAALQGTLCSITRELVVGARDVERPIDGRGDVVAHHLAAGLRVHSSQAIPRGLGNTAVRGPADPALLGSARSAWLRLATCEYVAVTALDLQLEAPAYVDRFADMPTAIVEGAANLICGARLIGRPDEFRHRRAWRHQAIALSYALEAYVAGLRGHAPSFAEAQLIALTRLVRSVAAIALLDLDLRRPGSPAGDGSSTH